MYKQQKLTCVIIEILSILADLNINQLINKINFPYEIIH